MSVIPVPCPNTLAASIRSMTERDISARGSSDWIYLNRTAWRLYLIAWGGLLTDATPPPADFGAHYFEPQQGIAA